MKTSARNVNNTSRHTKSRGRHHLSTEMHGRLQTPNVLMRSRQGSPQIAVYIYDRPIP